MLPGYAGRAEAAEALLSQAWSLQSQLTPEAQQAVYHNMVRARAAAGQPLAPEDQARMQGFLLAKVRQLQCVFMAGRHLRVEIVTPLVCHSH